MQADPNVGSLFEASLNEKRQGNVSEALAMLDDTHDAMTRVLETHEAERLSSTQLGDAVAAADIAATWGCLAIGNVEEALLQTSLGLLACPGHSELTKLESEIHQLQPPRLDIRA